VSVVTLTSGNRARRVPVRTGRRAGGWVELLSGPGPGTVVLLGGGAFVLDGEQVRPTAARPAQRAPAGGSRPGSSVPAPGAAGQPATGAAPPPAEAGGAGGAATPGASR
jgi:HlyD family secretion protein